MRNLQLIANRLGLGSISSRQTHLSRPRHELHHILKGRAQYSSIPLAAVSRDSDPFTPPSSTSYQQPDARFEVFGSAASILSVSLAALQNLYTRRGTLVAFNGKTEDVVSSLSILEPFRRSLLGIPFLYQRINSTTPFTALISSRDANTSFSIVHLDGTVDWMIMQRKALLAWTGQSLTFKPKLNTKLGLKQWGDTQIIGRGIVAMVGKGQIFQVELKEGEEYTMHPSNVLAYSISRQEPIPYRIQSSSMKYQVPEFLLNNSFNNLYFIRHMRESTVWKLMKRTAFAIRTWTRRAILGDRLFLRFKGPSTVLFQSRASSLADVLTDREINEIAISSSGKMNVTDNIKLRVEEQDKSSKKRFSGSDESEKEDKTGKRVVYATVEEPGKVNFSSS